MQEPISQTVGPPGPTPHLVTPFVTIFKIAGSSGLPVYNLVVCKTMLTHVCWLRSKCVFIFVYFFLLICYSFPSECS